MTGLLFRNWGYKLLALFMAVALWSVMRSRVTEEDDFDLPVRVQFAQVDGQYEGRPAPNSESVQVTLEGPASDLAAFRRLGEDDQTLTAFLDASLLNADKPADQVDIPVGELRMPGILGDTRLRMTGSTPGTVRIHWERILEHQEMAVAREVQLPPGWSPPAPDVQMTLRPRQARLHVRGPQAQLDDQTLQLTVDGQELDELFRELQSGPTVLRDLPARLTDQFPDVQILSREQPTVEVELRNVATRELQLPVLVLVESGLASQFTVELTPAAQAQAQRLVTLTGSRSAIEEQVQRIEAQSKDSPDVFLWVDARKADPLGNPPKAPVHVHGLPPGVTVEGLETRTLALEFSPRGEGE